jgi:hypothetical protein
MENTNIIRRWEMHKSTRKGSVEQTWDLIERYVMPMRGGRFFSPQTSESEIRFRRPEVYDETATIGLDLLAANINSSLTSFNYRWFNMRFRNKDLYKEHEAQKWLQECAEIMFYALYDSNFATEIEESYLDLVGFGNTVLVQEEIEDGKLNFSSVPVREIFFDEDKTGGVRNLYRELQWTASRIIDRFGADKCPTKVIKDFETGSDAKHTVILAITKRDNVEKSSPYILLPEDKRPYEYKYICENGRHEYAKGGYYEMPGYITRWRKTSGSVWGYGPGNVAIPSVMTVNTVMEILIEQAEVDLDPPLVTTPRGLIGDFDYTPRAINMTRSMNELAPFNRNTRVDTSQIILEDLRAQIRAVFMTDQLQMKESPQMSASEANIRFELMNRLLGPTAGMIQNDLLEPLLRRTFNQQMRAGQLPEIPQIVKQSQSEVDIEYTGPLSKAQRMDTVMSTERFIGAVAGMVEVFPDVRHLPNPEKIGRDMAESLGVPVDNLRSPAEYKKEVKKENDAIKAQQEAEFNETNSKTEKNLANAETQAAPGQ